MVKKREDVIKDLHEQLREFKIAEATAANTSQKAVEHVYAIGKAADNTDDFLADNTKDQNQVDEAVKNQAPRQKSANQRSRANTINMQ